MRVFVTSLLRPCVTPPALTTPPPTAELVKRPRGILAFEQALYEQNLDASVLSRFPGSVYLSYGSLNSARCEQVVMRVSSRFPTGRIERYDGLHHLNTSHQAEPGRVAQALHDLWDGTASRP